MLSQLQVSTVGEAGRTLAIRVRLSMSSVTVHGVMRSGSSACVKRNLRRPAPCPACPQQIQCQCVKYVGAHARCTRMQKATPYLHPWTQGDTRSCDLRADQDVAQHPLVKPIVHQVMGRSVLTHDHSRSRAQVGGLERTAGLCVTGSRSAKAVWPTQMLKDACLTSTGNPVSNRCDNSTPSEVANGLLPL